MMRGRVSTMNQSHLPYPATNPTTSIGTAQVNLQRVLTSILLEISRYQINDISIKAFLRTIDMEFMQILNNALLSQGLFDKRFHGLLTRRHGPVRFIPREIG